MGDEITIVPATPDDAAAAADITREAFGGVSIDQAIEVLLGPAGGRTWQDIKAAQVRREVQQAPADCFVAKSAGRVVGYVTTNVNIATLRGHISNLAVAKSFQGRGIGRRLVDRSLERFRGLGLKQAKIETLVSNLVASHLYTAIGFTEVARQVHYVMAL